jgi:uncharacterized protein
MQRSTRLSLFPDVNVWIALTYRAHIHHATARNWLDSLPDDCGLYFSRFTQIGFLRLLTTSAVMMNKVLSQHDAWRVYDDWMENGRAAYLEEPASIERIFRLLSQSRHSTPKDWADSYISAFARASGLRLVTFDQALHKRTEGSLLLS